MSKFYLLDPILNTILILFILCIFFFWFRCLNFWSLFRRISLRRLVGNGFMFRELIGWRLFIGDTGDFLRCKSFLSALERGSLALQLRKSVIGWIRCIFFDVGISFLFVPSKRKSWLGDGIIFLLSLFCFDRNLRWLKVTKRFLILDYLEILYVKDVSTFGPFLKHHNLRRLKLRFFEVKLHFFLENLLGRTIFTGWVFDVLGIHIGVN